MARQDWATEWLLPLDTASLALAVALAVVVVLLLRVPALAVASLPPAR